MFVSLWRPAVRGVREILLIRVRSISSCVVLRIQGASTDGSQSRQGLPPDERLRHLKSAEKKVAIFAGVSLLLGFIAVKSTFSGVAAKRQKLKEKMSAMPRPLVVAGPSGSGKSTLLKRLFAAYPDQFGFSISHTTRAPRPGEVNGREYHFTTREDMTKAIANGEFIESAEYSGNLYGTSKKAVRDVQSQGKVCVLDIDMQGVRNLKETDLNPMYVLIKPPSMEVLEKRLRDRKTETEESLKKRLDVAREELAFACQPGVFDQVVVNDTLDDAYDKFHKYIDENFGLKR